MATEDGDRQAIHERRNFDLENGVHHITPILIEYLFLGYNQWLIETFKIKKGELVDFLNFKDESMAHTNPSEMKKISFFSCYSPAVFEFLLDAVPHRRNVPSVE